MLLVNFNKQLVIYFHKHLITNTIKRFRDNIQVKNIS